MWPYSSFCLKSAISMNMQKNYKDTEIITSQDKRHSLGVFQVDVLFNKHVFLSERECISVDKLQLL